MIQLTVDDLAPFAEIDDEKAEAMIADALAMAEQVAPCIAAADFDDRKAAAAKAILRGAVLRWHDSGSGAVSSQTAGVFSQTLDTRSVRRSMFWPSEIEDLQRLCQRGWRRAFAVDSTPPGAGVPPDLADVCDTWDAEPYGAWDVPE